MKRSDIEKDFRKKLNQRTVQPSENSWNKLDELLTATENKKSTRRLYWLYIAASITGIAFLGTYFIHQNTSVENIEPQLVVQETINVNDSVNSTDNSSKEIVINPVKSLIPSTELAENKPINQQKKNNSTLISEKKTINSLEKTDLAIDKKHIENTNQKSHISVNVSELLASAENTATLQLNNSAIKVNASSLLSQVDSELEQSFKEKALQSINKNFNNLKTALASRNLED